MNIHTAESVTALHPDKICDQISDAILDACLAQDPYSRVAVETMGGHNIIVITGEVSTKASVDYSFIARRVYKQLTGKEIGVLCNIVTQAPEIAKGVNKGGAGDQGIMVGYACRENGLYIPNELRLARLLLQDFEVDGKSQVTLDNGEITNVVLSVQGKTKEELEHHITTKLRGFKTKRLKMFCNYSGSFETGGFDADSGVTGRKIVVDAYGPRVPVGGGAFSGKDATKVDRSAAYMARFIALHTIVRLDVKEVLVKLGYVIGKAEPLMKTIEVTFHSGLVRQISFDKSFDCRPEAIIERFSLRRPFYQEVAKRGSFGSDPNNPYPWEDLSL